MAMAKVAINGMGRIGRAAFKIIMDTPELELVALNDLIPLDNLVYLLTHDTVYRRYGREVSIAEDGLVVDGKKIATFSEKDPGKLPWAKLGIDVVFECTGVFTKKEGLEKHIAAGAKRVILSAPAKGDDITTVVYGVNQAGDDEKILSCASCTTNCITPIVEIMGRRVGIKKAIMTTVHSYTATQSIVDTANKRWTRGRAGAANFVPTTTGAALATTKVLPQYQGLFDGVAIRGPLPAGSIADVVCLTERDTTVDEVNSIFREEAESERYWGVLGVSDIPLVSSDIIMDSRATVIDLAMTRVVGKDLVKIMGWYDNEWGYTSQMIREAVWLTKA